MALFDEVKSLKLKIQNYKSFGNEEQGFETLRAINLLVGRNNSGKSALLDLVQFACGHSGIPPATRNKAGETTVLLSTCLSEGGLKRVFQEGTSGGPISGSHWEFGKQFVGKPLIVKLLEGNKKTLGTIEGKKLAPAIQQMLDQAAQFAQNPFEGKLFKRLSADRDIVPEPDGERISIGRNGLGFTNAVQRFINKSSLPSDLVEKRLLAELNTIFAPDASFTNIRVRQHQDNHWEIYLEEAGKGAVSLTHSGSGLKTVLLVLALLILVPHLENKPISAFVFAFEELENNLHPAMQRNLVKYICDAALKNGCLVFLTTHSSAIIDMLGHHDFAQIIHVTHSGELAKARHVTTYVENKGILDDLDVRASDLLQSNGIVWVEGPSDRLYFNRWIELVTDGKIQEGTHYQCVFYGGRLLAHLSGIEPFDGADTEQAVRIFRVNRNAMIIIDSDRPSNDATLNATKMRIRNEIESLGGFAWVTAGREVENYIPNPVLRRRYPDLKAEISQFDDMGKFLEQFKAGEGRKFEKKKVLFAETILPFIHRDDLKEVLDLEPQMKEAVGYISRWNALDRG